MMDKKTQHSELVDRIFESKEKYHRNAAKLPIEEKVRILVELQKIAVNVKKESAKEKNMIVWRID